MTKTTIRKSLIEFSDGSHWMDKKQIAKYFGCHPNTSKVGDATKGLPKIGNSYCVFDLADNIFAMQGK